MPPLIRSAFRRPSSWFSAALILWSAGSFSFKASAKSGEFQAGIHWVDITPTNYPVLVNAMFTERVATNTVDRLEVRALALNDGKVRLVLAVIDSCMVARDLIDRAKRAASATTGVPVENMMVSSTHTHSAPSAMGCLGSRMDTNYARFLEPRIAEAIIGAVQHLEPAQVGWGTMDDWDHTFNRRYIRRPDRMLTDPFGTKNVRAHMHPGYESPDVTGPSGPVDPGLSVVAFRTPAGRPLALFANYSQHYYGSPLLSSDYYGRFRQHVAGLLGAASGADGARFMAIMSQGTSGDQMWMDYSRPAKDIGYDAYAKEMATNVAAVVRGLKYRSWVPLAVAERKLEFSYRAPDAERLAWARQMAKAMNGRLPGTLPEVYALESIYLHERPRTELVLQALRIGEVGIAAIPNEVYALTGLKLKGQSPLSPTINVELANGAEGYIPPPEQHRLGGYTTWAARTAGLEESAEPQIVEGLLQLLESVSGRKRQAMPEPAGSYTKAVLASKPMAYWRLNEAVTPVARDATGQGRDAQLENGIAVYLPGASATAGIQAPREEAPNAFTGPVINRAIHLAGGRLLTGLSDLPMAYSVEFWFWNGLPADARGTTGVLLARGGGRLVIHGTNGVPGVLAIALSTNRNSPLLTGHTVLGVRRWHHVVFVTRGNTVAVYLDGREAPEIEGTLGMELGWGLLTLGGADSVEDRFEGKLDEVAVYPRALKPREIVKHHRLFGVPRL